MSGRRGRRFSIGGDYGTNSVRALWGPTRTPARRSPHPFSGILAARTVFCSTRKTRTWPARLYSVCRRLHDAFGAGAQASGADMRRAMKELIAIGDEVRKTREDRGNDRA